jgi:hypothetical protein
MKINSIKAKTPKIIKREVYRELDTNKCIVRHVFLVLRR